MSLDLPTRPSAPLPVPPEPAPSDTSFLCEHYARSALRRQRWLFVRGTTGDAHTALVWLLERAMCLIEQLPTKAGRGVWRQLPTEADQAAVVEALAEGKKYELTVTVVQPSNIEQASCGGPRFVEADTTQVFTIEPEPADPVPAGTGRRRKTSTPNQADTPEAS